jgi:hypothetical protein
MCVHLYHNYMNIHNVPQGDAIIVDGPQLRYSTGIGVEAFLASDTILYWNAGASKQVCMVLHPLCRGGRVDLV